MKLFAISCAVALMSIGCGPPASKAPQVPGSAEENDAMTAEAGANENRILQRHLSELLTKVAFQADASLQYHDDTVVCGERSVRVSAISETTVRDGGKWLSAARFEVSVDGGKRPELTFGSIGIDNSAEDAASTAVTEWYMLIGKAMFRALGRKPPETRIGSYSVYAGFMGMRGEAPGGWLDGSPEMHARLFKSVQDHLPSTSDGLFGIDVKIVRKPDGSIDGQCLIAGRESKEAIRDLKKLEWPVGNTPYMLKQAYIVARAEESRQGARADGKHAATQP